MILDKPDVRGWYQVRVQVRVRVWDQVRYRVRDQVLDRVWNQAPHRIRSKP